MAQGQLVVYFYEHVDVLGDTLHSGVAAKTPAESFRSLGFSFLGDAGPTFIVVVVRAFVFHQVSQGHSAKQKNRQEAQQPKRGATNRPRGADASVLGGASETNSLMGRRSRPKGSPEFSEASQSSHLPLTIGPKLLKSAMCLVRLHSYAVLRRRATELGKEPPRKLDALSKDFIVALRKLGQMPTGLSVNAQEETWSWGLLHFSAHKGEVGLMEWLLKQKARPDVADEEGNTPLVLCAKSNHVQAMEMLMARGASILQRTKEQGFTPLLWAAVGGHKEVTKSLLQADADVEEQDYDERTPLIWASRLGHMAVVKILLKECPDLTWRDKEGLTALDHCREHLELRAAVVLAQEQYARLMDGAQRNDLQAVEHLLEHGAVPRYRDASGWTPLHWAVLHDASEMSKLLVRYGASPELLGEESELCSQLAKRGRRVGTRLAKVLGANTQLLTAAEVSQTSRLFRF
ncbi:ANK1 [Symbiodinium natans]|uniref:ANK1 protein n=1 Tax=Symbiodinium natans TaxID=878477 RepID=A0A812NUW8_9DINO|nr:ANK1 [Symbiodinium natans]